MCSGVYECLKHVSETAGGLACPHLLWALHHRDFGGAQGNLANIPRGRGKSDKQQQIGNILTCHEQGCDECVPIKLAMTPIPVELWPRSNDTDVSCTFIAQKSWFLSCVEQSTTKCFHCCIASYLVVKTILFAHCSRKYWMNAKTWDPANSLSIVGFLGLICVQGPLNSSLSPLNANLVSNLYQANVFFCMFCCLFWLKCHCTRLCINPCEVLGLLDW